MLKRFTKGYLLLLVGLLGACSTVQKPSVPTGASTATKSGDVITQAEGEDSRAAPPARAAVVVPVPPLKSGNAALFERSVELLQAQKYAAAQVLLLELTDSQPELAGPWVNLSYTYLADGDQENAELSLQKALQANPKNCDALNQLGVLARQKGEFTAAESFYQRCIDADPNFAAAYLNLGILYELYMGKLGEALAAYNDYQVVLPAPDRQVAGWVMDLERRVGAIAQR